ncbi:MAG TPA: PASTA domain-containing protein, partial [Thermoanaerobaculia bacterium]
MHDSSTVKTSPPARPAVCRLIVVTLCIVVAPFVCGQIPGKRTLTRPPYDDTKIVNPATSYPVSTVPSLFGMNRTEAGRFMESLRLRATFTGVENGVVVAQKPLAGTSVR